MIIKQILFFFNIILSFRFILMVGAWVLFDVFYNRFRKNILRLTRLWGSGSVLFLVYVFLYCFVPVFLIGFAGYFFVPFLMGGSGIPHFSVVIFLSIIKLSFFVTSLAVLTTMLPAIREFSVNRHYFFESAYVLIFFRLYIDSAYSFIQPGIFISGQYGRFHPPLYVYILTVVFVFFGEKYLFDSCVKFIKLRKLVKVIKGVFVQILPLVIISQAVVVSYSSLRCEPYADRTDPADMPSLNVIFQSYLVQEILYKYTAREMGYCLADCILSGKKADNHTTRRKYNTITLSPVNKSKYY